MNSLQLLLKILNNKIPKSALQADIQALKSRDWEELLFEVDKQGVKLILSDHLRRQGLSEFVPDAILEGLRAANLLTTASNVRILHHAGGILKAFKKQNLNVIGLKGLYLVESIYQHIGSRNIGDLDLLIRKKDLQRALHIMQKLGYKLSTWYDVKAPNKDIKHVPPMFKTSAPPVELHWTILEEDEPFTIDTKGLWERALPATIAGVDMLALSPEDLILHLCLHLTYQHHFNIGLRSLVDVATVLHHFNGQVDWQKLADIAQGWGATRVLWLSMILVGDILGIDLPSNLLMQIEPTDPDPWIIEEARSQLISKVGDAEKMTPDLAKFAAERGLIARLRLILQRIFLPKSTLARHYNVSPRSLRVYGCYFKRAKDLFKQYRGSVKQILDHDASTLADAKSQQNSQSLKNWMGDR